MTLEDLNGYVDAYNRMAQEFAGFTIYARHFFASEDGSYYHGGLYADNPAGGTFDHSVMVSAQSTATKDELVAALNDAGEALCRKIKVSNVGQEGANAIHPA